ncbi:MAG TPA: PQQ-binding-like beta-propeller repeat protein, partial [Actinomycetota bacterium]|nr:PQQ-binding-like beta-propeller repeat protein [Actinomycetota bacterium]
GLIVANDDPYALAFSPDGSAVFVTGTSYWDYGRIDYLTVAYESTAGARMWARTYNGPTGSYDIARSIAVSPDGAVVFVTGISNDYPDGGDDFATLAYSAATGGTIWERRYNPAGANDDAYAISVSPDGSKVFVTGSAAGGATDEDYATLAYDAATGADLWSASYDGPAHNNDIAVSQAISPDGTRLFVTGYSYGGDAKLWDYATIAYEA